MFPYWRPEVLRVGSLAVAPTRLLVACALVLGHFLLVRRACAMGLDEGEAAVFSACLIGGGPLFGQWFKLLYWPGMWAKVLERP